MLHMFNPIPWSASSLIGCPDFDQYLELSSAALRVLSVFGGNNLHLSSEFALDGEMHEAM